MASRRRMLLKVIILGDSGYRSFSLLKYFPSRSDSQSDVNFNLLLIIYGNLDFFFDFEEHNWVTMWSSRTDELNLLLNLAVTAPPDSLTDNLVGLYIYIYIRTCKNAIFWLDWLYNLGWCSVQGREDLSDESVRSWNPRSLFVWFVGVSSIIQLCLNILP